MLSGSPHRIVMSVFRELTGIYARKSFGQHDSAHTLSPRLPDNWEASTLQTPIQVTRFASAPNIYRGEGMVQCITHGAQ